MRPIYMLHCKVCEQTTTHVGKYRRGIILRFCSQCFLRMLGLVS